MEKEKEKEKKRTAILGAFPDTLVLNVVPTDENRVPVSRDFSESLKQVLDSYKALAQAEDDDVETDFTFEQLSLLMTPKGGKGFSWIMKNTKLSLAIARTPKRALWAQVRLSSEYLWAVHSLPKILCEVGVFLSNLFNDPCIKLVLSAVDLTVDLANLDWGTVQNIQESFISRAQLDSPHVAGSEMNGYLEGPEALYRRWRRLTGFSFGARAAAVSAVIYDKYHEIKYKRQEKGWFFNLWRQVKDENGEPVWDGESPVWRVEMRLRREALNEMMQEGEFHGIDDAFDLERLIPGLWAYLVGSPNGGADGEPSGWLRYAMPTDDKNRSRWPVHPDWKVVQSAFQGAPFVDSGVLESGEEEPQDEQKPDGSSQADLHLPVLPEDFDLRPFIRRRRRKVNSDRMIAQIAGCLVTLEAWRPRETPGVSADLSDTLHYAYRLIGEYLEENERDFSLLVEKKRVLYSIETAV